MIILKTTGLLNSTYIIQRTLQQMFLLTATNYPIRRMTEALG